MKKETENWLQMVEYDIKTAECMLETGRYVYVVFMCHLAIEKMLKAIVSEAKRRQEIKGIVKRYAGELKNLGIIPEKIMIYGSYAKGHPREGSDIDLLIVSKDFKDKNLRERLEILGLAAGRVFEPIEAMGYTEDEIVSKEEGSFLDNIFSEGVSVAL
ncbi:MAG: HEPN domain-containing protein [Nitrospinae bacterium]|nr:HEPN domain-containing protein [Nitrospinota bacterium]